MLQHISNIFLFPFHIINIYSAISKGNANLLPLITLTQEMLLSQANWSKKMMHLSSYCQISTAGSFLVFLENLHQLSGPSLKFTRPQTFFCGCPYDRAWYIGDLPLEPYSCLFSPRTTVPNSHL